jgi:magnesium-transporting ATPase (P-type)
MAKSSLLNIFTPAPPEPVHLTWIITGIILAFVYYKAYEYLDNLRSCNCAPKGLNTLKNLEMFFIILTVFLTVINVLKMVSNKTKLIPNGSDFIINAIYLFFMLAIQIVYIYNVYVYIYSTDGCACMDQWQKYILYIQSIYYSLFPILIVILLLLFGLGPALLFFVIISCLVYYAVDQMSQSANQVNA